MGPAAPGRRAAAGVVKKTTKRLPRAGRAVGSRAHDFVCESRLQYVSSAPTDGHQLAPDAAGWPPSRLALRRGQFASGQRLALARVMAEAGALEARAVHAWEASARPGDLRFPAGARLLASLVMGGEVICIPPCLLCTCIDNH